MNYKAIISVKTSCGKKMIMAKAVCKLTDKEAAKEAIVKEYMKNNSWLKAENITNVMLCN